MTDQETAPGLPAARLKALVDGMRGRRLVVVGDAMLDRYLLGDARRVSPEAPVPVVSVTARRAGPGGAANVAANLAAVGAEARLVGVVGRDVSGSELAHLLAGAGIADRWLLSLPERPTTTKTRVVARGQQVVRIDEEDAGPLPAAAVEQLLQRALDALEGAEGLLLQDYNKGVLAPALIAGLMDAARTRGLPVIVDPKYTNFFGYAGATVFKPNRRELQAALGAGFDPAAPEGLAEVVRRLEVEHLLLTLGAGGMLLVNGDGRIIRVPSTAREVFDVSGAGDTVTAWLGAALAAGATVVEAALVANRAAGVEVAKAGVATVEPGEILGQDQDGESSRRATGRRGDGGDSPPA